MQCLETTTTQEIRRNPISKRAKPKALAVANKKTFSQSPIPTASRALAKGDLRIFTLRLGTKDFNDGEKMNYLVPSCSSSSLFSVPCCRFVCGFACLSVLFACWTRPAGSFCSNTFALEMEKKRSKPNEPQHVCFSLVESLIVFGRGIVESPELLAC